jgi:hypothetical protein
VSGLQENRHVVLDINNCYRDRSWLDTPDGEGPETAPASI